MSEAMTPQAFADKWGASQLKESAAYQEHFLDLCEMLGQGTPAELDSAGKFYTFQKGASKSGGGEGFADVWYKDHFAWEYKGKHKNLDKAYDQLLQYREDLENPPLLVVCDFDRYRVHTNFNNCVKKVFEFTNGAIPDPETLRALRCLWEHPEGLKPEKTVEGVTEEAANKFARLADGLHKRGEDLHRAAHFLMKLLFCLFAQRVGLLPNMIFTRIVQAGLKDSDAFTREIRQLFKAMAQGGRAFLENIDHFNGGLFADAEVCELDGADLEVLYVCTRQDWSSIEPAIFGTLFERSLDPSKRSQAGAHFTGKADILTLVEPVLMRPLRREWAEVKKKAVAACQRRDESKGLERAKRQKALGKLLKDFGHKISTVRVLDPACGSGNFLYVSLHLLLDLEKEVFTLGGQCGVELQRFVDPRQLFGMELNPYAVELAQLVVWIGYIQWNKNNGLFRLEDPILRPLDNIKEMDAIMMLKKGKGGKVVASEPEWPECDVIVGNPPFLGGKKMRTELGDVYLDKLFELYEGGVPHEADLCCYWFEKGRRNIAEKKCKRVGLLATQGIRGGANREVLKRIKETGDIFFAISDREWILEGANVHISMIGFDDGTEPERILDGLPSKKINPNLSQQTADITQAAILSPNASLCFMGTTKGGPFEIDFESGKKFLFEPNPHKRPNSDVILPWMNGEDVVKRWHERFIIDFGVEVPIGEASKYARPFEYIKQKVYPKRKDNNREQYRRLWWIHVEPRPLMRKAMRNLERLLITTRVSKHRLFAWIVITKKS